MSERPSAIHAGRPVKTMKPGRRCHSCGDQLSIYNRGATCSRCVDRQIRETGRVLV